MILPVGAKKFEEALQIGAETYHHLKVNPSWKKKRMSLHLCIISEEVLCSIYIYLLKTFLFSAFPDILYNLSCVTILAFHLFGILLSYSISQI